MQQIDPNRYFKIDKSSVVQSLGDQVFTFSKEEEWILEDYTCMNPDVASDCGEGDLMEEIASYC